MEPAEVAVRPVTDSETIELLVGEQDLWIADGGDPGREDEWWWRGGGRRGRLLSKSRVASAQRRACARFLKGDQPSAGHRLEEPSPSQVVQLLLIRGPRLARRACYRRGL